MVDTPDARDSRNGEEQENNGKWPELTRVEQHLKDLEKRNAALKEAMDFTRSAGCLWRFAAAICFFGSVLTWWMTDNSLVAAGFAALGIVLLTVAVVRQKDSKRKENP